MALLSSRGTSPGLDPEYTRLKEEAARVKRAATDIRAGAIAGTQSRRGLRDYMTNLTNDIADLTAFGAVRGLLQYARDQEDTPGYDVATNLTTTTTAMTVARDWIVTNYPKSPNGFLEMNTLAAGNFVDPGFRVADLADLVPLLDALIASID